MPTMTLKQVREQYPQYEDMSDRALADALHERHYSDMPREDFDQRIGLSGGQQSTAVDVVKSGASGVARGALDLLGLPGTVRDLAYSGLQAGLGAGYEAVTGEEAQPGTFFGGPTEEVQEAFEPVTGIGTGQQFRNIASELTGGATAYEPQTTAGEYAGTVGEFVPGAVAAGGLNPANLGRFAALPGVGSEAAGQATEGTAAEPYARIAGALLAPAAVPAARRAVTPVGTPPERARAADTLRREGVEDLTAGQQTGSQGLRYMESELGGARAANMMGRQAEQFTSAVLRRAGINANKATPEVIDDAFTRIGKQFDDLAARNEISPDGQMVTGLRSNLDEYRQLVPESARAPIVENVTRDIVEAAQKGAIPGSTYQSLRSRIDKAARSARISDPERAEALRGIRNSLDDAMDRSIAAKNPADSGAWRDARREYRNMLTIERAATGAGEQAAEGLITPARLRQATVSSQGRRAYARGQTEFDELSRAGQRLMTPLPQSGTAPRQAARNAGMSIPSLLGAGGGASAGGPIGAALGAAAGAAVPYGIGRGILSRAGRAYLGNNALPPVSVLDPRYQGVAAALLGQTASGQPRLQQP